MVVTSIQSLHPLFKPIVVEFIALCVQERLNPVIINTYRTIDQHKRNLKNGTSWRKSPSLHCGKNPSEKPHRALAIDIAPEKVLAYGNWLPKAPEWQTMGRIAGQLGLSWGGLWHNQKDYSHFEINKRLIKLIDD